MINKNEKEQEYYKLVVNSMLAKSDYERELVEKKIVKFEKENPNLVDEVQRRRWTAYGS